MRIKLSNTELYYEKNGVGKDLILLHGNGEDLSIFDESIKILKQRFCVYCYDSRGHGKSQPTEEYHYTDMAQDLSEFINELALDKPIIFGFSDGAIVALLYAIDHSHRIDKLILSGINLNPEQLKSEIFEEMHRLYLRTKDPKIKMMLEEPQINNEQLREVKCPVYYFMGEDDVVSSSRSKENANQFIQGVYKEITGFHHGDYIVHSDIIASLILEVIGR